MRNSTVCIVVVAIAMLPTLAIASQKDVPKEQEAKAFREMAAAIPLGSRVKLQTATGRRVTATLMSTDSDGIIVKKNTRLPEPAIAIRFDELARLERVESSGGVGVAKAIGIGLAAGAGAILTLFTIAFTLDD